LACAYWARAGVVAGAARVLPLPLTAVARGGATDAG
jgi:hypothetical protein